MAWPDATRLLEVHVKTPEIAQQWQHKDEGQSSKGKASVTTGAGGWLGTECGRTVRRRAASTLGTGQSGGNVSGAWQGLSGRLEAEDEGAAPTRELDCGGEGGRSPPGVEAMRARQERGGHPTLGGEPQGSPRGVGGRVFARVGGLGLAWEAGGASGVRAPPFRQHQFLLSVL